MSERQRLVSRAGAVYALLVSFLVCSVLAFPWQLPSQWKVVEVASAQTAATTGNNGAPTSPGGIRLIGSDNTTDHWVGVDASGNVYTYDRSANTAHLELNIRANNGLKTKFVSAPIDMSLMGSRVNVSVRGVGPVTASVASVYLGAEGAPTSVFDSTSVAPFQIGRSNPLGTGTGLRTISINQTTLSDSTFAARPAELIPLSDSTNAAPFSAPWMRLVLVTTSTQLNNVYLHVFGWLR